MGFTRYQPKAQSRELVGSFSGKPSILIEYLYPESTEHKTDLPVYANVFYQSTAKMLGNTAVIAAVKNRKFNGIEIVEFSYKGRVSKGTPLDNIVHIWTQDNLHFWQLISVSSVDDVQAHKSLERFLEFLVQI